MKLIYLNNKKVFILLISAAVFVFANAAYAGIAVTPERHIVNLKARESAYVEYEIYNSGAEPINISTSAEKISDIKENEAIDLTDWLGLSKEKFTINPQETKALGINIKIPENATGELNAMVYLSYKESRDSMLNIKYGMPVYAFVKETESIRAEISFVNISLAASSAMKKNKKLILEVSVKNTGNVHIWPKINARFYGYDDKLIEEISLQKPWPVFGQTSYLYKLFWENFDLKPGAYKCEILLDYEDQNKKSNIIKLDQSFIINENGFLVKQKTDE